MIRTLAMKLGSSLAQLILGLLHLAALGLSPWRIGRLLRSVSMPRIREHPLRTSFTVLGVALGVAILVGVIIVSRSIVSGVTATVDDLAGKADLQVSGGSSGFDEAVLETLRGVPGIYKLTPVVQQVVTLRKADGSRERLLLLGVDLLAPEDKYFRSYASKAIDEIQRDPVEFLNSSTNLILGREIAERLRIGVHDKIELATPGGMRAFDVWGTIDAKGVGRAFGGAMGVMYYPSMLVAFDRGRNIDRVDIAVEPGRDPETVAAAIRAVVGEAFSVERPNRRGDRVAQMLTAVRSALTVSSLVALIAGAFLVVNTMSISVVQRKRELGILRALGATRRDLVRLLTLEGLLFGIVGSAVGLLLAVGLSRGLLKTIGGAVSEIYLEQSSSVVEYEAWVLVTGLLLGIVSSTGAAYLASRRAGAIKPSEALSSSALPSVAWEAGGTRADVLALGLLIGSVILLQIPPWGNLPLGAFAAFLTLTVAGRALMPRVVSLAHAVLDRVRRRFLGAAATLASTNLKRDTSRTAGTASGLMAGAALTICAATFISSYITSLNTWSGQITPGDLFVTSGAAVSGLSGRNNPVSEELGAQLAAMPGIAQVRPTRSVTIDYQGLPVKLQSTDIGVFARRSRQNVLEGTEHEAIRGMQRGGVVVSENFSHRFDIHPGDSIALSTKTGTRRFEVAGVVADYSSDLGLIRMDRATYIAHWNDRSVDTYELFVAPGTTAEAERIKIDGQFGERYDLFVLTNGEFRAELVNSANKIFSLMHVLEVITLLVAAMGMVTALLASVLDRIREIGVLRAVGMLRAQIRNMVIIEATFIGAIGTIGGILLGLGLGYIVLRKMANVQTGWYLPYELPFTSVVTLLVILIPLAAFAGFYPARQAARLTVRDALDYE